MTKRQRNQEKTVLRVQSYQGLERKYCNSKHAEEEGHSIYHRFSVEATEVLLPGNRHWKFASFCKDWRHCFYSAQYQIGLSESESESDVAQSCPTLWDHIDGSLPGSEIHGIFQARILEWAAISFSRGSSQLRDRTWVFCIADRRFTIWATRVIL